VKAMPLFFMILNYIESLIHITENEHRGVLGKINKYSGDILAGAAGHLIGRSVTPTYGDGVGGLSGVGAYGAYKLYDRKNENNKSISGSLVGAGLGATSSELGLRALKQYTNYAI